MEVKNHNKLYGLMIWMGIVPFLSSATITLLAINYEPAIANFELWAWLCFYLITIGTMALAITPTTFIALISGYFLGFSGLVPIIVSYQMASLLGYNLAKKFDDSFIELIKDKYPSSNQMFENVNQNQFLLVQFPLATDCTQQA